MQNDAELMYYDVHTHQSEPDTGIVRIENLHGDFNSDLTDKKVSLGMHPWYLAAANAALEFKSLSENATKPEVLAIGECGLDKLTNTDWDLQLYAFRKQIGLAEQIGKPIVIHCVRAFTEVLAELRNIAVPAIFHGVNNKLSVVRQVIDQGYYLSFGKSLLMEKEFIKEVFREVPLDRVFLETDDSGGDIREIYKSAARIRNITEKEIVLQIENNFKNVFRT